MTLHFASEHVRPKFTCSKKISAAQAEIEKPKVVFPFCKDCFMK